MAAGAENELLRLVRRFGDAMVARDRALRAGRFDSPDVDAWSEPWRLICEALDRRYVPLDEDPRMARIQRTAHNSRDLIRHALFGD